ncbi:MAG: hypothetical protein ABL982_12800 [Vicinamibacterales bacterium]
MNPPLTVRVFAGPGSRVNRVHVFDRATGTYLTKGYARGSVLFVKRWVETMDVVVHPFVGRAPRAALRRAVR